MVLWALEQRRKWRLEREEREREGEEQLRKENYAREQLQRELQERWRGEGRKQGHAEALAQFRLELRAAGAVNDSISAYLERFETMCNREKASG